MSAEDYGIAGEAHGLVHGERAKTYGHPRYDFRIIAKVWSGLLQDLLKDDAELDEYRIAIMMTGLKLARLVKSPKHHDSRVDTIGYMLTMERLDEPEFAKVTVGREDLANASEESPKFECGHNEAWHKAEDVEDCFKYKLHVKGTLPRLLTFVFPLPDLYRPGSYIKLPIQAPSYEEALREFDKLQGRETAEHSAQLDALQDAYEFDSDEALKAATQEPSKFTSITALGFQPPGRRLRDDLVIAPDDTVWIMDPVSRRWLLSQATSADLPDDVMPKCPAHGERRCELCSQPGEGCQCGYYEATGMHWDTCPGRLRTLQPIYKHHQSRMREPKFGTPAFDAKVAEVAAEQAKTWPVIPVVTEGETDPNTYNDEVRLCHASSKSRSLTLTARSTTRRSLSLMSAVFTLRRGRCSSSQTSGTAST